ncbi:MAG: hypothetical protein ACI828_001626 [Flavobacteriales bacterium]|jgi:hypothetical protein
MYKMLFFLLSILLMSGCKQETTSSLLPSSWIGTIQMGGATPELAFYVYIDSLGQPAGHLGFRLRESKRSLLTRFLSLKTQFI